MSENNYGALMLKSSLTGDLNKIGDPRDAGVYFQISNDDATNANNYPAPLAGVLLAMPSAYGLQQEYTAFSDGKKFIRGLSGEWNGVDGPWMNWVELATEGSVADRLNKKQSLDATLTALAALATGADKLPYFTGNDTASQTDLTSVGRDIIGKNAIADVLTYLRIDRVEQLNNETKIYAGDDHSIFLSIRIDGLWGIYDPLHGFIPLGIEQGGTGARDAGGARTNLGLGRVEQRAGETVIYCDDKKTAYFTAREDNQWGLFDGVKFVPLGIGQGGTGAGDAAGARQNLELGDSSTKNTGTTANTVAAGDDSRFSLMLGVGQSWQNVTGNRFSGTVYTNNTGKPIQVFALWNDTPPTGWGYGVGTLTFSGPYDASGLALGFLSLVVPAGDTYFMRNTNISHWWELR